MGKVINVKKLNFDTIFGHGALMWKHELALNVDRFGQGVLRSKHKLSLNVDTFVGNFFQANEGLVTKNSGPLRAREGDRKVRLG